MLRGVLRALSPGSAGAQPVLSPSKTAQHALRQRPFRTVSLRPDLYRNIHAWDLVPILGLATVLAASYERTVYDSVEARCSTFCVAAEHFLSSRSAG